MRIAFKEWAVVVDALLRGEQIIILRKGGIHEARGGFKVEHERFWLFPTLFHQQRESVIRTAQARYDAIAPLLPGPDKVRIEGFCEVADWRQIESLKDAQNLRDQHVWTDEVIADRFEWGRQKNIFALAVFAYKLSRAVELPMLPQYGGCKSWIELAEDLDIKGAQPVLGNQQFEAALARFRSSCAGPAGATPDPARSPNGTTCGPAGQQAA